MHPQERSGAAFFQIVEPRIMLAQTPVELLHVRLDPIQPRFHSVQPVIQVVHAMFKGIHPVFESAYTLFESAYALFETTYALFETAYALFETAYALFETAHAKTETTQGPLIEQDSCQDHQRGQTGRDEQLHVVHGPSVPPFPFAVEIPNLAKYRQQARKGPKPKLRAYSISLQAGYSATTSTALVVATVQSGAPTLNRAKRRTVMFSPILATFCAISSLMVTDCSLMKG